MIKLTFYQVFKNVYLILFDNEIVGKVVFNDKNEIITLDINGCFFHIIKSILLNQLLFHLGVDFIILNTLTQYQEYYEELGFKVDKNINHKHIQMRYKKL